MRWLETIRLRLRGLLFRAREDRHLHAEMQFHLEALIAENIAAGMSPEEARYAAMRAFGNATAVTEQTQETWGWTGPCKIFALPRGRSAARRALH